MGCKDISHLHFAAHYCIHSKPTDSLEFANSIKQFTLTVRRSLEQKSTEELLQIWGENDKNAWSDDAFIAIRQILEARGENPGPQATESKEVPAQSIQRERPGCVTAVALLTGIGATLYALVTIAGVFLIGGDEASYIGALTALLLASLIVAVAVGLWQLKNWARIAVIVLQSLGILLSIALLSSGFPLLSSVIGLVVGGYSIYWFAVHGEYFRTASSSETPMPIPPDQ